MLNTDEDALICDLAETYSVYDYRSLPIRTVATLSVGLRADSRIKLKQNNLLYPVSTLLLASMADRLGLLVWSKSEDCQKGINRPASIFAVLSGRNEDGPGGFDSPEDFEAERRRIIEGGI